VTLERAHRILIGAAIVLFLFYGVWEYAGAPGRGSVGRAAVSVLAAVALGAYFRTIGRGSEPPRPPAGGPR
jgi:hypothetical protein